MADDISYNSPEYKAWKYAVMARDGFKCQITGDKNSPLEVHHIVPWSRNPSLRYVVSNGITLSKEFHQQHVNGREADYEEQFKQIVAAKKKEREAAQKLTGEKPVSRKMIREVMRWHPKNPRMRF